MAVVHLERDELDELPPLCMRCGQPSTLVKNKMFSWSPFWVLFLVIVGFMAFIPLGIVLALVLAKRAEVPVPLCAAHKNHWRWRILFILISLALLIASGVAGIILWSGPPRPDNQVQQLGGYLVGGALAGLFLWLIIAAILQNTAIRASEITDYEISLTNVARDFAEEIREVQDRFDREEEEEDRPRPRRRPPRYD